MVGIIIVGLLVFAGICWYGGYRIGLENGLSRERKKKEYAERMERIIPPPMEE